MEPRQLARTSRFLSKHLRHAPERIGLELAPGGWVEVDVLLDACRRSGVLITRDELEEVVAGNDKQRYTFDEAGTHIRANQGHSVDVDLKLVPAAPPSVLFHGTARKKLKAIRADGLRKMRRHHVHLSADCDTAIRVGRRHGEPVVLAIDAAAMHAAGHEFSCSANGVWLTDQVAPEFLELLD